MLIQNIEMTISLFENINQHKFHIMDIIKIEVLKPQYKNQLF